MAKSGRKPFQSGREIMETYIPGYVSPLRDGGESAQRRVDEQSGTLLADMLLKNFGEKLDSLTIAKKSSRSNRASQ